MDSDNIKELERLTQCTKTASKCVVCGKELGADAIYYINGDAFCSQSCRDISDYRDNYGGKIDKTIAEYIPTRVCNAFPRQEDRGFGERL